MKTFTAYIVDDEPLSIRSLKKKLELFPEVELLGESTKMERAIAEIRTLKPEILFLDIQLAEGTGFDLLDKVEFTGKVIFITAFDEYAFRAFEINALDYLLKPISQERLQAALDKAKSSDQYEEPDKVPGQVRYKYSDRILVLERNQIRFVLLENVTMISAARDYTTIETIDGKKSLIMRSMADWMNRLPAEHFIRVHRSYIVNMNHIDKIVRNSTSTAMVFLKNHHEPVSLSRTYYNILRERYL